MSLLRSVALFLGCTSCMGDNMDVVQVTVQKTVQQLPAPPQDPGVPPVDTPVDAAEAGPMACDDATYGFINNGEDVTGYLKSCPISKPWRRSEFNCRDAMCLVDPDRYTCCTEPWCTCPNGAPTTGNATDAAERCEMDGSEDCVNCTRGWYLNSTAAAGSQSCLPNSCTCEHGVATTHSGGAEYFCANHGDEDCSSCHDGHHMSAEKGEGSQTCENNTCSCSNGVATIAHGSGGTLCKDHGAHDCSGCHLGYSLSSEPASSQKNETCEPDACSDKTGLIENTMYDIDACKLGDIKTDQICQVGCGTNYVGNDASWTCYANGTLKGEMPSCTEIKCAGADLDPGPHTQAPACASEDHGHDSTCAVQCADGYYGTAETYTCKVTDGTGSWVGDQMICWQKPCNYTPPANGGLGDCTVSMASGTTCGIACNDGYDAIGQTECSLGNFTERASCEPCNCTGIQSPDNGGMGDCTESMEHGSSCQPSCNTGYYPSGPSTCDKGEFDRTVCHPCLYCQLIYEKKCSDTIGYWSSDGAHLDYQGCEDFCNNKAAQGHTVFGCELDGVTSAVRSTVGGWCFAHTSACTLTQAPDSQNDNAACDCLPGPDALNHAQCPQHVGGGAGAVDASSDATDGDATGTSSSFAAGQSTAQNVQSQTQDDQINLAGQQNTSKHGFKRHVR